MDYHFFSMFDFILLRLQAKLDNGLRLGISYVQNLRPGIQLTMSSLLNAKSLENGGHKLGLSLNLSA